MEYPRNITRADVNIYYFSQTPIAKYKDVFVVRYEYGGFSVCSAKQIISIIKRYSEGHPSESILINKVYKIMSKIDVCDDEDKRNAVDKIRQDLGTSLKHYSSAFACEYTKIRWFF